MTTVAPPPAPNGASPAPAASLTSTAPLRPAGAAPAATGLSPSSTSAMASGSFTPAVTPLTPLRAPSPFPTVAALALTRATQRELEQAFQRGATPDLDALVGWEFRGINHTPPGGPPLVRIAGIQKFVKGMFRTGDGRTSDGRAGDGRVMGYNSPVVQNVLDGRWRTKPSDTAPKRFGFYEVAPVDATARDNHYLHALLLDYGKGGNAAWDPTRGLRDYLVQVDATNPDLFLGKAYYAIGPARIPVGFFVLERFRRGPTELPPRSRT